MILSRFLRDSSPCYSLERCRSADACGLGLGRSCCSGRCPGAGLRMKVSRGVKLRPRHVVLSEEAIELIAAKRRSAAVRPGMKYQKAVQSFVAVTALCAALAFVCPAGLAADEPPP